MTPEFLILHGTGVSLILELSPGEGPLWRYWGPRLPDDVTPGPALRAIRPAATWSLDEDFPLGLFPTFGVGWYGQSALLAHRDGADFAQAITGTKAVWIEPGRRLELQLTDAVAALRVTITLDLDPVSDVLTVSPELTNIGADRLEVSWLASGVLPLPAEAVSVRSYSGRHNSEFIPLEDALGRAIWRRENRRGLTSHDAFPGAVATTPGTTRDAGVAYGAQLAWSGSHAQSIEWLDDGRHQWQMGMWLAPGELRLGAGESVAAPEMLATVSDLGLNGVAQNFHAAIRRRMSWPGDAMRPRPVSLNTWEGFYFDHRLDALQALATSAAELGVERFVLDDGWFHRRDDDTRALGDWWPDAAKYPDGLGPLANHVTGLGMEFGLWVEPEMVNPDSELYRAHPDWALQIAGRPQLTGRNQLVLDLTRAEVADHLFDRIAGLLLSLPIAYLKWDHNRDLTAAGGSDGRARYRRQVLALYSLLDRIRAAFPDVEIESCAGGGGRIDAGVLTRTHRVWTSDCIDAVSRVGIQRGFLQFMPPEIMGSHVGAAPAHSTGRRQSLDFRAGVALPGHFGVELNVQTLNPGERAALAAWIAAYKQWRGRLHSGRVWLGDAGDDLAWQAHGSSSDLLLFVYRTSPSTHRHAPPIRLAMLEPGRRYQVHRVDPNAPTDSAMARMDGSWLSAVGLPAPALKAERCAIYSLVAD